MKKYILSSILLSFILLGCGPKPVSVETPTTKINIIIDDE